MNAEQVRTRLLAAAQRYGSQKALAEAIGVSAPFICDIINGRREPSGKPVIFLGLERKVIYVKRTANGNE